MKYLFIALGVLFSSLRCSQEKYPPAPANSSAESFVVETRPVKIGDNSWSADYGTITVAENRSSPASRLISIPFLRIHGLGKNTAEPIFGLGGGPGNTNMAWDLEFVQSFLSQRDFVMVGYRGADGSTILDCPEVKEALKKASDPFSENSMTVIGSAWTACGKRLLAQGVDLNGYTIPESIADNESVRKALGYEHINLLSRSYGTRVAYLYGLEYPEHIFRSAMIGVNPPGHFVWEPGVTDAQLKYYANLWSKNSLLSARSSDLYATLRKVPEKWLFFSINPAKVRVATFFLLYHRKTAAQIFDAYVAAENGDASGLALLSLAYDFILPGLLTWGDLASKGVSADFDSTRNYSEEMDLPGMALGAPGTKLLWGPLSYGRWPVKLMEEKYRKPQPSNVETLILSGSIDFSTPAELATKELLPALKNGRQIILSEYGHVDDVLKIHPENTRRILTSFYDTGVPNTSLNAYVPMNFTPTWRLPLLAKMLLTGVILFTSGFVLGVVALIRKISRKDNVRKLDVRR